LTSSLVASQQAAEQEDDCKDLFSSSSKRAAATARTALLLCACSLVLFIIHSHSHSMLRFVESCICFNVEKFVTFHLSSQGESDDDDDDDSSSDTANSAGKKEKRVKNLTFFYNGDDHRRTEKEKNPVDESKKSASSRSNVLSIAHNSLFGNVQIVYNGKILLTRGASWSSDGEGAFEVRVPITDSCTGRKKEKKKTSHQFIFDVVIVNIRKKGVWFEYSCTKNGITVPPTTSASSVLRQVSSISKANC
jgi:hypothetical protein